MYLTWGTDEINIYANDSFNSKYEINIINKLLSKLYGSVLDDIDDKIEVWIIGNKDKDFFNNQVEIPIKEHIVLDPFDVKPPNLGPPLEL